MHLPEMAQFLALLPLSFVLVLVVVLVFAWHS
jgi:hypothetical protein